MLETHSIYHQEKERVRRMQSSHLTLAEALALLARQKGYYSDRPETLQLASLLQKGLIAIEQIEPLDIQ